VLAGSTLVSATHTAAGEWELEVHGGGLITTRPSSGQATLLPGGASFQTVSGVSSRRVSSWYFGDGGRQIQQTRTTSVNWGYGTYQSSTVVGPLDPVLSSAAVGWPFAAGGGLRLGRRLGRRFSAELGFEYGGHAPGFTRGARVGLETSRSAFESAWNTTLSSLPGSTVSSRTTLAEGTGRQLVATAVLDVNLATGDAPKWSRRSPRRRFVSYLTLGAGVVSTAGDEASATLVGRYQFSSAVGGHSAPFQETDTVTIRSSRSFGARFVGVVGLGWKQDLSSRMGLRFDARAHLGRTTTRIVMDARPSVATESPSSAVVLTSDGMGAIQFVNSMTGDSAGHASSLSGPAIAGFETFETTGMMMQINISLGVFLRF
jgi:hypothetical protein